MYMHGHMHATIASIDIGQRDVVVHCCRMCMSISMYGNCEGNHEVKRGGEFAVDD